MKGVVAAIILVAGFGCAQADVYKWTDESGEVHYGDFSAAPNENAKKVLTQEQIQQDRKADQSAQQIKQPANPPDYAGEALDEIQHRRDECQRYKNLRDDRLMSSSTPLRPYGINRYGYGFGYDQETINVNPMGMSEIEAGIRKYCLE